MCDINADRFDLSRIKASSQILIPDNLLPRLTDSPIFHNDHARSHYFKQRVLVDQEFDRVFMDVNKPILDGVRNFVKRSIKGSKFPTTARIHAATLLLAMQISDHDSIYDLIEKVLKKDFKDVRVQRIKASSRRKRNLLELLDVKQTKTAFILIEQAETIDTSLAEVLVGNLTHRVEDEESATRLIMILFCLSSTLQDLSYESVGSLGQIMTIKGDREVSNTIIKETLFRGPCTSMKLRAGLAGSIYDCFANIDASIAHVRHLYKYTLLQFAYYHLPKAKNRASILNDRDDYIKKLSEHHNFLCYQLYLYYELFKSKDKWPDDVLDLYEELLNYENLAESSKVYDALSECSKLGHEQLLVRIKRTLERATQIDIKFEARRDSIRHVLLQLEEMFENNEENDSINSKLRPKFLKSLMEHSETMKNPLKKGRAPDFSEVYFDTASAINNTLDTKRYAKRFSGQIQGADSYYSTVLSTLIGCPYQVSLNDFWNDCQERLEGLVREERDKTNARLAAEAKLTATPRKKKKVIKDVKRVVDIEDDKAIIGLTKSIFLDIISTMEHEHIIKLDRKGSKGLLLKRSFWPGLAK